MVRFLLNIIICFSLPVGLLSQDVTREREAFIKSSEEYYFSQFLGDYEDEAKRNALDGLMYKISESQHNAIDINTLKVKVTGIEYLTWSIGTKIKALAFVKKTDVKNILKEKESLMVVPIEYTESVAKNTGREQIDKDRDDNHAAHGKTSSVSQPAVARYEQPGPEIVDPKTVVSSLNPLIRDLSDLTTVDQLAKWLRDNRYGGGIVSGGRNDFPGTEAQCYIVIFNPGTNKIVAVLTPNQPKRFDLKTGKVVISLENEYKNLNAIWVQTL